MRLGSWRRASRLDAAGKFLEQPPALEELPASLGQPVLELLGQLPLPAENRELKDQHHDGGRTAATMAKKARPRAP